MGGSAVDTKSLGGCTVWAPAAVGTSPAAASTGLGQGMEPSGFPLQRFLSHLDANFREPRARDASPALPHGVLLTNPFWHPLLS